MKQKTIFIILGIILLLPFIYAAYYPSGTPTTINWSIIDSSSFPSACPGYSAITQINESIICSDYWIDSVGDSLLTGNLNITGNLTAYDLNIISGSSITLAGATFENKDYYTSVNTDWGIHVDEETTAFLSLMAHNDSIWTHANIVMEAGIEGSESTFNILKNSPLHPYSPNASGIINEGNLGMFIEEGNQFSWWNFFNFNKDEYGNVEWLNLSKNMMTLNETGLWVNGTTSITGTTTITNGLFSVNDGRERIRTTNDITALMSGNGNFEIKATGSEASMSYNFDYLRMNTESLVYRLSNADRIKILTAESIFKSPDSNQLITLNNAGIELTGNTKITGQFESTGTSTIGGVLHVDADAGLVGIGDATSTGIKLYIKDEGKGQLVLYDTTAMAQGVGPQIGFIGKTSTGGGTIEGAEIDVQKTNAVSGDYSYDFVIGTTGESDFFPIERLRISGSGIATLSGNLNVVGETTLGGDVYLPTSWFMRDANRPRLSIGTAESEISSPDGDTEITLDNVGAYIASRGYSAFDADATSTKLWGPGNNGYLTLTDTSLDFYDSTRTRISADATNTKMISPDGSKTVTASNAMIDAQTTHFNIGDYVRTRFDTKTDRTGLWGPDGTSSVILSNSGTAITGPTTLGKTSVCNGYLNCSLILEPYSFNYSGGSMSLKGAGDGAGGTYSSYNIDNFWGYMRIFTGDNVNNKYLQIQNVGTKDILVGINIMVGNPTHTLDVNGTIYSRELFKLATITLPTCDGSTDGSIGRNATKLYFCDGSMWNGLY